MNISTIPRAPLACLPTPVEDLPRLSEKWKRRILIKRDDLTGLATGGNKTRKLEFLAADAMRAGANTLVTCGAAQSNHCRQTAAAAAKLGLRCHLVLAGTPQPALSGNLLLDRLLGATWSWMEDNSREAAMEAALEARRREGFLPYAIPYGGSNPLGAVAYALAVRELMDQGADPDWILFATSSGGTQAGLTLGKSIFRLRGSLVGISVDQSSAVLQDKIRALIAASRSAFDLPSTVNEAVITVDDRFIGEGYGVMGDPERTAILEFAQLEGVLLDPVYTGRAASGMLEIFRQGGIPENASVLFWHTGGIPALWSYGDQI